MVWIRTAALATVSALIVYGAGKSAPTDNEAVYSGGTLKSIPSNTRGAFDITDSSELRFEYGATTYRLPYSRIRGVHFSKAAVGHKTVAHLPVPKLPALHRSQVLDLSFTEEGGGVGTASFHLTGKALDSAEWTLSQRMKPETQKTAGGARTKLSEAWWGDKYWKTNRNKSAWPDPEAEGGVAVGGSK